MTDTSGSSGAWSGVPVVEEPQKLLLGIILMMPVKLKGLKGPGAGGRTRNRLATQS